MHAIGECRRGRDVEAAVRTDRPGADNIGVAIGIKIHCLAGFAGALQFGRAAVHRLPHRLRDHSCIRIDIDGKRSRRRAGQVRAIDLRRRERMDAIGERRIGLYVEGTVRTDHPGADNGGAAVGIKVDGLASFAGAL